jgi:hypothetical protein
MPFCLTNSLATFMRMMDDILQSFTNSFVVVYLDGILIQNLGGTFVAYSIGIGHPPTTQVICQFGELFLWHAKNPIFAIHRG